MSGSFSIGSNQGDNNRSLANSSSDPLRAVVPPAQTTNPHAPDLGNVVQTSSTELERLRVEQVAHAVVERMLSYLGTEVIPSSEYPKIRLIEEGLTAYCALTKSIDLLPEFRSDGFTMGEEIAHWLHHRQAEARGESFESAPNLSEINVYNAREFVGYIGREVAYQACKGSELEALFDPKEMPATIAEPNQLLVSFMKCMFLASYVEQNPFAVLNTRIDALRQVVSQVEKQWSDITPLSSSASHETLLRTAHHSSSSVLEALEELETTLSHLSQELSSKLEGLSFAPSIASLIAEGFLAPLSACKNLIELTRTTAESILRGAQLSDRAHSLQQPAPSMFIGMAYVRLLERLGQAADAFSISSEQLNSSLRSSFTNVIVHHQGYAAAVGCLRRESNVRKVMLDSLASPLGTIYKSSIQPMMDSITMSELLSAIASAPCKPS